jgi:hypothetical protein
VELSGTGAILDQEWARISDKYIECRNYDAKSRGIFKLQKGARTVAIVKSETFDRKAEAQAHCSKQPGTKAVFDGDFWTTRGCSGPREARDITTTDNLV